MKRLALTLASAALLASVAAAAVDPTHLPVGDGKISSAPRSGYVFSCRQTFPPAGGAFRDGPRIRADGTFDLTAKIAVGGAVAWPQAALQVVVRRSRRIVTSRDLPVGETTGTFPVSASDPAYAYDRNPNSIVRRRSGSRCRRCLGRQRARPVSPAA
jgi:hypothetical protein